MNKCIQISVEGMLPEGFLEKKLLPIARTHKLEGVAFRSAEQEIKITVCGLVESLDDFLDALHKELAQAQVELDIIPFLKDKEYRGVFRVIE